MLALHKGVKKDEAGAAKILLAAAARGNPIAQNRVAHLYVSGEALPKDMAKAAAWNSFAKAAGLKDDELDVATVGLDGGADQLEVLADRLAMASGEPCEVK